LNTRRRCRGETASRAPSDASLPVSSTPSMISWMARQTSSAVYQELIAGRFAGLITSSPEIDHELVTGI
jgi:hypothetical protein